MLFLRQFGEVGREHGRGVDHRITLQCASSFKEASTQVAGQSKVGSMV